MGLTGLETLLIGSGLALASGAVTGGFVWIRHAKDKVDMERCTAIRERIETAHRLGCPMSHNVLTAETHRQICTDRTDPLKESLERIERNVEAIMARLM